MDKKKTPYQKPKTVESINNGKKTKPDVPENKTVVAPEPKEKILVDPKEKKTVTIMTDSKDKKPGTEVKEKKTVTFVTDLKEKKPLPEVKEKRTVTFAMDIKEKKPAPEIKETKTAPDTMENDIVAMLTELIDKRTMADNLFMPYRMHPQARATVSDMKESSGALQPFLDLTDSSMLPYPDIKDKALLSELRDQRTIIDIKGRGSRLDNKDKKLLSILAEEKAKRAAAKEKSAKSAETDVKDKAAEPPVPDTKDKTPVIEKKDSVAELAQTVVGNIINASVQIVEEAKNPIKNIKWITHGEFTVEKCRKQIEEFVSCLEFERRWVFYAAFIEKKDLIHSFHYIYRVRWSAPTAVRPLARVSAEAFFTVKFNKSKPPHMPVEVSYVFENSDFLQRPGKVRFREEWLRDITETKNILLDSIPFKVL